MKATDSMNNAFKFLKFDFTDNGRNINLMIAIKTIILLLQQNLVRYLLIMVSLHFFVIDI